MKVLSPILLVLMLLFSKPTSAQTAETFPAVIDESPVIVESLDERARAIDCLASNMYFEARGESERGKIAVAMVTINRAKSERYPDELCAVVKQPAQFSWYRPGKIAWIKNSGNALFQQIRQLATMLYDKYYRGGKEDDVVHGATFFHTKTIHPRRHNTVKVATIGNHVFLKVRQ